MVRLTTVGVDFFALTGAERFLAGGGIGLAGIGHSVEGKKKPELLWKELRFGKIGKGFLKPGDGRGKEFRPERKVPTRMVREQDS